MRRPWREQPSPLTVCHTVAELRQAVARLRQSMGGARSARVAFVPTMGALHAGHLSLIDRARFRAERVVVSIFVNPRQFNDPADYRRYPRDTAADLGLLQGHHVDLVWLPTPEVMYPAGYRTRVEVDGLTDTLCGAARPGHFAGVTTVVSKLLLQVQPDLAVFGEKDFQQLQVIRRLARDLDFGIEIVGAPTVREHDGLAMSSRNQLLTAEERAVAPALYAALRACRDVLVRGRAVADALATAAEEVLSAGFRAIDYLSLVEADTLQPVADLDAAREHRLAVAAWLGPVRLIDNIAV